MRVLVEKSRHATDAGAIGKSNNGELHKTSHGRAICNRNMYTAPVRTELEAAATMPNRCETCFS